MNAAAPIPGESNDMSEGSDDVHGDVASPSDARSHSLPAAASGRGGQLATDLPFAGLVAPTPVSAAPPLPARWLAFAGVLVGGLLGGLIGYGTGDLLGDSAIWASLGALVGGLIGAVGVGIVASLTLRAMNEWTSVQHPEARLDAGKPLPLQTNETMQAEHD